jgi:hypothetical protein
MIPVWLAVIFMAFAAAFMITQSSDKQYTYSFAQSSRDASAIISYKNAVIAYLNANPTTGTGTITDASLAAFWPEGFTNPPGRSYSNYLDASPGGTLYIFSSFAYNNEVLEHLYRISGGSVFVGTKNAGGDFVSYIGGPPAGLTFTVPVAAGIPNDAIVILGK